MKYIISKMKGAFYAGSEQIYAKGLKLKKYLRLSDMANMVKSLHLSASSLIFKGVSRGEQSKIAAATGAKAKVAARKGKKAARGKKAAGKKKGRKR